jgi:hypothetical protein
MPSLVWCYGRGCCENLYLVADPASWSCPWTGVTGGIVLTEGKWLTWTNPVSMLSLFGVPVFGLNLVGQDGTNPESMLALFAERHRKFGLLVEASRHAGLEALLPPSAKTGSPRQRKHLCDLIRDVLGYPCRPVPLDAAWQTPAAVALAQTIYDERRFLDLPILADALEEAGCNNTDIFAHCRGPGSHARGCWVVDLILGKA